MLLYPYVNIYIWLIIDLAKFIQFKLIAFYIVNPGYDNSQIIYSKLIHTFQPDSGAEITWIESAHNVIRNTAMTTTY